MQEAGGARCGVSASLNNRHPVLWIPDRFSLDNAKMVVNQRAQPALCQATGSGRAVSFESNSLP